MEDLSARYGIALTPTSQESGNIVFDPSPAMTAPGSLPAAPLPGPVTGGHIPGPHPSGPQIAVSSPRPHPGTGYPAGAAGWVEAPDADDQPAPSPAWKQL